jgi:hypothetical protein
VVACPSAVPSTWPVSVGREQFGSEKDSDAARDARLPSDQPGSLESEHHLVDGGRADPEVPLRICFSGRPAEYACIGIDEGQILTLLGREGWNGGWG